jgi:RNA polymerase sigma-70 factor (ECF subfamily)
LVENRTKQGKVWDSLLCVAPIGSGKDRLFVAVQPERKLWMAFRGHFHEEWTRQAAGADHLAGWMAHWLGGHPGTWEREAGPGVASEWLGRAFIAPTRARFAARMEDGDLLRRAKEDADSFGAVYVKYWPVVRGYFRHHLDNPYEADDLAQDVFVKAFVGLDRYETRNATYKTFLLRIAHRVLLNRVRVKPPIPIDEIPEPHSRAPLQDVQTDRVVDVERVFGSLRPEERALVEGFYFEGHSIRELALRFGKTENALKLSLSRIRRRFRTED